MVHLAGHMIVLILAFFSGDAFSSSPVMQRNRVGDVKIPFKNHLISTSYMLKTRTISRDRVNTIQSNMALHMSSILSMRGGGGTLSTMVTCLASTPSSLFHSCLGGLALSTVLLKFFLNFQPSSITTSDASSSSKLVKVEKPNSIKSLQLRFLIVFWLLRCADWLQGPYFYEVYATKVFHGQPASLTLISQLFLTGFASTALLGPFVGRATDVYGRKRGTLAFALLYSLGAASTKSPLLGMLLLGRVLSGIGTSLLFSAPESWLVGEALQYEKGGDYLGETFGLAYAGDSLVAILAGQMAGAAAGIRGPSGPFELSIGFLGIGALLASFLWKENVAEKTVSSKNPSIADAWTVVRSDKKILLAGAVQSLFEAAMYIFVLQWPPAISKAISTAFGSSAATPYGAVFSCFMASCLLGSTIFGKLTQAGVSTESFCSIMLTLATVAMGLASWASSSSASILTNAWTQPLSILVASFFAFEACVGMYFPSIGTLRSKYIPDSHRSVIMNIFGIPLNAMVVGVFLSIKRLGVHGALLCSTTALTLATLSMFTLSRIVGDQKGDKEHNIK